MEKITYSELLEKIYKHNEENHISHQYSDKNPLICCVCFAQSNFDVEYSELSRTYRFRSDEKRFLPLSGGSIFADCLDGTDHGVRLDWYRWKPEYAYIERGE